MPAKAENHSNQEIAKALSRVTVIALLVSTALTGFKFWGWRYTDSQAVYSDFLESIVNIVAGFLAIIVVRYAAKPADREHPYGHGKIEYFSAAFEGGLIVFAAIMIFIEAIPAFTASLSAVPQAADRFNEAALIALAGGLVNFGLGFVLKRVGRAYGSPALVANGEHILSDFITSAGVTVGLALAHVTGLRWLDPLIAVLVGLHLAWTGGHVVRKSVGGLLDEEDLDILKDFVKLLNEVDFGGVIQIHHTRILRSGRFHHIDAHAVVPEFWDVSEAHDRTESFEARLMKKYPQPGELHLHVDPCRQVYCRRCDMPQCPIRKQPFESRIVHDLETLISPHEPDEYRRSGAR